jgi:hypothetical protein
LTISIASDESVTGKRALCARVIPIFSSGIQVVTFRKGEEAGLKFAGIRGGWHGEESKERNHLGNLSELPDFPSQDWAIYL